MGDAKQPITLDVRGMSCGGCASAVAQIIKRQDGAAKVAVDLPTGKVRIEGAEKPARDFANALSSAGYPASGG